MKPLALIVAVTLLSCASVGPRAPASSSADRDREYPPSVAANGRLLVTIGGTGSVPGDFEPFARAAAARGFHVLSVGYPNRVISTTCRESRDPLCFDHFREEIVLGRDVSPLVAVDEAHALLPRIESRLRELGAMDARWRAFLGPRGPRWDLIWVAGHSQGSGHAAYISKLKPLERVLLFAGPQDYFTRSGVAPWIRRRGATPPTAYRALLHRKDFFGVDLQLAAIEELTEGRASISAEVVEREVHDPHNAVISPALAEDWEFLFR